MVCVHNTPGRSRLLACRQCRSLARCERCDAAVALDDAEQLSVRALWSHPPAGLSGVRCRQVRQPATGRVAPARGDRSRGRPAGRARDRSGAVSRGPARQVRVYVGTEAALHRVEHADTVAFLDFDRELLAPRYRAGEQAMALLARAATARRSASKGRADPRPDVPARSHRPASGGAGRSREGWPRTNASNASHWACHRSAPTPRSRAKAATSS